MSNRIDRAVRYKGISFHYYEEGEMTGNGKSHRGLEIIWFIKGTATFNTVAGSQVVTDGTLIIIPPRAVHWFEHNGSEIYKYVTVNIQEYNDERNYLLRDFERTVILTDGRLPYIKTLKSIEKVLREKDADAAVKTWLYCTSMAMFAQMHMDGICFGEKKVRKEHSPLVQEVIMYIDEHLCEDVRVNDIAASMNVSVSTLFHSFKKEIGVSVYKYLLQKRMTLATDMIEKGERPTEIYYKCGFKDYPNFYRAYRANFGTTPSGKPPKKTKKSNVLMKNEAEK